MKLLKITDPAFKKYGRVIDNIDFSELTEALKKTPVPEGGPACNGDNFQGGLWGDAGSDRVLQRA